MKVREIGQQTLNYCREQGWVGFQAGISLPVPKIEEGETHLWYFVRRSQVRVPRQILFPPYAQVGVAYPSGRVVAYRALSEVDTSQPLGSMPHDAARAIPASQWEAIWDELFELYRTIIAKFAAGLLLADPRIIRFVQLFHLATPPFMLPHYRALNPAFFDWLEQVVEVPEG